MPVVGAGMQSGSWRGFIDRQESVQRTADRFIAGRNREDRSMFKLPLVIIYMVIAFNITAFTVADLLLFDSLTIKIIASILTVFSWFLAYINRNKFVRIG